MAKKKKAKKKVKKKAKKKVKRKIRKIVYIPGHNLHRKKLEILRAIPIMPCSVISKDRQGLRFAHTQAEKVYQVYRRECEERGLVIRRVEGKTTNGTRPTLTDKGKGWIVEEVPCVRFEGKWEICDAESGETETFGGSGDGDNEIWSANSAQTIARKQALLDYFEVAWPQPTDWVRVIRESLEDLEPQEFADAVKKIIPEKIPGIVELITSFFDEFFQKGKRDDTRINSKRKG